MLALTFVSALSGLGPLGSSAAWAGAPTASSGSATTAEDTAVAITLTASDPDSNPLTYSIGTNPTHGSVSVSSNRATYTPSLNYNGTDTFTFRALDSTGLYSSYATVTVTVTAVNDAPTATSQTVNVNENSYATIVLAATDPESHRLTYTITSAPRHGAATLVGKRVRYTPTANYSGSDQFGYSVSDGVYTATATVSITVVQNNHAPTATNVAGSGSEDVPLRIALPASDEDGDVLTYTVVRAPANGSVTISGRTATYVGDADWSGSDSFTWKASDSYSSSSTVTANVTLSPVNDAPVAEDVTGACDEDTSASIRLNSTDVDGRGTTTYAVATGVEHGVLIISGSTATYRPAADFAGTDTFTYTASDGTNTSAPATGTITVRNINDAPVVYSSMGEMPANSEETFIAEKTDPDSSGVTWALDSNPSYGRVTVTATGFRYTPNLNYYGKDRWTWHATDGTETSDIATFEVNIHPPPSIEGRPEMPQIGLNKIQFGLGADAGDLESSPAPFRPSNIFADFEDLGVQTFRQAARGDLVWSTVELSEGNFTDGDANSVVDVIDQEPTCTLFELQYASPTPPWCADPADFQKFMTPDAYTYLDHILDRYSDSVGFYEIGNEMYHWVAADPPVEDPSNLPTCYPEDGYAPSEQALFVEEASRYMKAGDPGAIITLSSVATSSDQAYAWLEDVIGAAGDTDWFDVISYHAYDNWGRAYGTRDNFADELLALGVQDKLTRMTEYGSTSDADFTDRTDYPNSDATQCADLFRETLIGWGYGDATTIWHTYLPVTDEQGGEFQGFEIMEYDGTRKPSWYAFQLLTQELVPFKEITNYSSRTVYAYKVTTTDDEERWVFWGDGFTATIPEGMTEYTSVMPSSDNSYDWIPVEEGDEIDLVDDIPILVR